MSLATSPTSIPPEHLYYHRLQSEKDWTDLLDLCPYLTSWGLKTLSSGLIDHARLVVIERSYICKDHRNLHSHYYSKRFREVTAICARMHFFASGEITRRDVLLGNLSVQENYIGFAVIRPGIGPRCLGRSVFDPCQLSLRADELRAKTFILRKPFHTHLAGHRLTVRGYPYMAQDAEAMLCAQTALWGVCRYLSEAYSEYAELHPYDIIALSSRDVGRSTPYQGLNYRDYATVLSHLGCHPVVLLIKPKKFKTDEVPPTFIEGDGLVHHHSDYLDLCAYVESGFPVLASVDGHVVEIVGHTLDFSRSAVPDENGLASHTQFFGQFMVIDDNFFPFKKMGWRGDIEHYGPIKTTTPQEKTFGANAQRDKLFHINQIIACVCPLPEKVFLDASRARAKLEAILLGLLQAPSEEIDFRKEIHEGAPVSPIVSRIFVATGCSLQKRKLAQECDTEIDAAAALLAESHLPHFVWVLEAAPVSIYKLGLRTVEIIIDATSVEDCDEGLLWIRVGKVLFPQGSLEEETLTDPVLSGTFRAFSHNLGNY